MKKKSIFKFLLFLLLLSVIPTITACSGINPNNQSEVSLEKIRLPMGYIPNVQYAPFYMAVDKGYFKEAGLDIEFDYSFETNGVILVGANELPLAVASGEQVLMAREQKLPVVFVMGWWQDYPVGVVAKIERGIKEPEDLKGKKIGLPGLFGASYIGLRALLNVADIDESEVTLDSIGYNQVEALISDQDDAVVIYTNNEPIQLKARGYEIDTIRVADYVLLASNGIISNEATIQNNPALVQKFIDAFTMGLSDVLSDPEYAFEVSKKYIDGLSGLPDEEQEIQKAVLMASIEFWKANPLGYSNPDAWQNMQEVLLDMDLISPAVDPNESFTNQFIH